VASDYDPEFEEWMRNWKSSKNQARFRNLHGYHLAVWENSNGEWLWRFAREGTKNIAPEPERYPTEWEAKRAALRRLQKFLGR
jgi:hypothetical protein